MLAYGVEALERRFFMPNNNEKAAVRTLLFVMISLLLIHGAGGFSKAPQKREGLERLLSAPIKEVISWIVPA